MTLVLIVLLVLLVGGSGYGYRSGAFSGPYIGGGLGLVGLIVVVLLVMSLSGHIGGVTGHPVAP